MKNKVVKQFKEYSIGLFSNPQIIISVYPNFMVLPEDSKEKILLNLELLKLQTELYWEKNEK